jgi:hypothetical protein
MSRIEKRLREERMEYSAPAGFTDRVMAEVAHLSERRGRSEENAGEMGMAMWAKMVVGFAMLAIAGVLVFEFFGSYGPEQVAVRAPNSGGDADQQLVVSEFSLPQIRPEQFGELAVKMEQPLEKELENVINDTRSAIQFVASHFLPEK